jgi:hypothetical protein
MPILSVVFMDFKFILLPERKIIILWYFLEEGRLSKTFGPKREWNEAEK